MGPVVVVVAIGIGLVGAIGAKVTSDMVEDLKRQINRIIDQHKGDTDRLKAFQELLKKLDMEKVYDVMKKVNEGVSGSFKVFLIDQQERMEYIKSIKVKQLEKDPLVGVFGELLQMLNIIGTELMAIELLGATNPATAVLSGVMLVLSGILGIFTMVGNIMAIGELKGKKEELINYFKPGGEFEQAQIKLKDSAIEVTRNLYLLIVNGKNLLKMLSMRLVLIQMEGSDLDYGSYLQALQADPFDHGFEQLVLDTYLGLITIRDDKNLSLGAQITRMYRILDEMMKAQNIEKKLQQFTSIISNFTSESEVAKKIQSQYAFIHKLNESRVAFAKRFEMRSSKKGADLVSYDERLLKSMGQQSHFPEGTTDDKKKLHLAELVSFFTPEFFGDPTDKSGKTLYSHNLKELQKKTQLLEYADAFEMSNAFVLPKPLQGEEKVDWNLKQDKLLSEFMKNYKGEDKPFPQFMYMRMQNKKTNVAGDQILTLNIIYGIILKIRGETNRHQMSIDDLNRALTSSDIIKARIQSYLTVSNVMNFVTSPAVIEGVDYVLKGQLTGTLDIMHQASKFMKFLPESVRHFMIGSNTLEQTVTNFRGLSINLRDTRYDDKGIHLKEQKIPTIVERFLCNDLDYLCSSILLFVTGFCLPQTIESIQITNNGDLFEGKVEWSKESHYHNFQGKILLNIIIKSSKDLQELAQKLRDQKKELFVVTVTSFQTIVCWYLE